MAIGNVRVSQFNNPFPFGYKNENQQRQETIAQFAQAFQAYNQAKVDAQEKSILSRLGQAETSADVRSQLQALQTERSGAPTGLGAIGDFFNPFAPSRGVTPLENQLNELYLNQALQTKPLTPFEIEQQSRDVRQQEAEIGAINRRNQPTPPSDLDTARAEKLRAETGEILNPTPVSLTKEQQEKHEADIKLINARAAKENRLNRPGLWDKASKVIKVFEQIKKLVPKNPAAAKEKLSAAERMINRLPEGEQLDAIRRYLRRGESSNSGGGSGGLINEAEGIVGSQTPETTTRIKSAKSALKSAYKPGVSIAELEAAAESSLNLKGLSQEEADAILDEINAEIDRLYEQGQ